MRVQSRGRWFWDIVLGSEYLVRACRDAKRTASEKAVRMGGRSSEVETVLCGGERQGTCLYGTRRDGLVSNFRHFRDKQTV